MSAQLTLTGKQLVGVSSHDEMAFEVARTIRDNAVKGVKPWSGLYKSTIIISSSSEWPEPDFVFDDQQKFTYGFEFKPPDAVRREYILGVGQALAYLNHFSFSTLILPTVAEGFDIAQYVGSLIKNMPLKIGLISYEPKDLCSLKVVVPYPKQPVGPLQKSVTIGKVFWAFWMDESIHEFYLMMRESYRQRARRRDIKKSVFKKVFEKMKNGKTHANNGRLRKLGKSLKFSSWFLNYKLPFLHCGLWSLDGKLTLVGTRILTVGDAFGWDSVEFRNALAKAYLENGKHLLLMKYIWNIQVDAINKGVKHAKTKDYLDFMAKELLRMGFGRALRGVRRNLQAMISLWGGGFNLLKKKGNSYYFPKFGLVFDWGKITSILQTIYW